MSELKLLQCRLDGRYDIEECLSRGSYAEIYVARDRAATDEKFRRVVIKALNVLLQGYQDPELEHTLIQNFQNEAIALDRVRHPNIISRLGHGTALDLNGTAFHYIVLEYLGGGDLAALARHQTLALEKALFYLQQVCSGLAHAHVSGVIHRDIKPENVMLRPRGYVKVLDFGLAKALADDPAAEDVSNSPTLSMAATRQGVILGTAAYMSPEQAKGKVVDRRADVWAFGAVLYEMLTGKQLFTGDSIAETLAAVIKEEPALDNLPPSTPAPIRNLLRRCLDRNVRRRLVHIGEARIAIEDVFAGTTAAQ